MNTQTHRLKGIVLMVSAGLCWSTGGILVRSVTLTDPWEIVFWRALFMTLFMAVILVYWYRAQVVQNVTAVGFPGLVAGTLLASTFFFFILSVTRTTVADTLVLMSTTPFVAAVFGRFFLGEQVPRRTYLAMTVGLVGILLMFADALGAGNLVGNVLACYVPFAFAANIMILRRMGASVDMAPTVLLAGLVAVPVALLLGWPLSASLHDITVLAIMGTFQLGCGCLLMTLATRHLSAAEIGLLSLLETALGPLWVWLGIGERPSDVALLGGIIVLVSLVANEAAGLHRNIRRSVTLDRRAEIME
jgi:drug/metabolite transporter (DMT)-like permease